MGLFRKQSTLKYTRKDHWSVDHLNFYIENKYNPKVFSLFWNMQSPTPWYKDVVTE